MINMNEYIYKIAVVDDDDYWLNLVEERLKKENKTLQVSLFSDFEVFHKFNDINKYDYIITDFHFGNYNISMLELNNIFKSFKGIILVITGNPNMIEDTVLFEKIINKSNIVKPTFKFSRYLKIT